MRSKPSRNESKWIEMNRIAWLRVPLSIGFTFFVLWPCGANGVCKWRSFQKPLKKHAEPAEGLQNAISNHFRALWHARDWGIINQSMEICIRFIWHIYHTYIWGIFTSGNTRFNHIGKLVSKSLFDLPLKKMGPLWVHNRERQREKERERRELILN